MVFLQKKQALIQIQKPSNQKQKQSVPWTVNKFLTQREQLSNITNLLQNDVTHSDNATTNHITTTNLRHDDDNTT